jgi:hypothetical protein
MWELAGFADYIVGNNQTHDSQNPRSLWTSVSDRGRDP